MAKKMMADYTDPPIDGNVTEFEADETTAWKSATFLRGRKLT